MRRDRAQELNSIIDSIRRNHNLPEYETMTMLRFMFRLSTFEEYKYHLRRHWDYIDSNRMLPRINILIAMLARRLNADGISANQMTLWFDVSPSTIGQILRGELYRDVPGIKDYYIHESPLGFYWNETMDLRQAIQRRYGRK